jgi:aryl-alcohol dehydrogenase-like predicted oxidoreductase
MQYRRLGKTGFDVSEVSLGTWQVGGGWGTDFDHAVARSILERAVAHGINFLDTADVYDGGESEKAVGNFVRNHSERLYMATKCGRQLSPHVSESYTPEAMRGFVEQSLKNAGMETLDLIQLHCPPTDVYYRPEIFETFEKLADEGKIRNVGVSVEKVEEALKAIEYPNVATVQIIFNMFRMRPAERFFKEASARDVGIIVRVPLASGLLSGKLQKESSFAEGDHRNFNRNGKAFDVGETFSGIPLDVGVDAVEELRKVLPENASMAQWAIKWILMHEQVSCVIPGASRPEQVEQNVAASDLPDLSQDTMKRVEEIYEERIKPIAHQRW